MIVSRNRSSRRIRQTHTGFSPLSEGGQKAVSWQPWRVLFYPERQTGGRSSPLLFSILFVLLAFGSITNSAYAEQSDNPANSSSVSFAYGPALWGSGSILDGAGNDLELLAGFINTGILYEPTYTPIIQQLGPIYQAPEFELRSDNVAINYQSSEAGGWSWGVSFRYLNVWGRADVPLTYVQLDRYTPLSGFYQTTEGTRSWFLLATSYALDGTLAYHFSPGADIDPYLQISAGVGRGFLGDVETHAWLMEYHAAVSAGLRFNLSESYFLYTEAYMVGHWAVTQPRNNPIDFTEVLVNPEKGSLYLGRLYFGAGFRLN